VVSSLRINNGHISYELGKETVWSRVTAEPTKEPRTTNRGPIPPHLVLLRVVEPFDVFEWAETNERKQTSEKEQTGRSRRCIKGTVRNAVVSLDKCLVGLMGVQRPFTLGVIAAEA
jgi:hypothetical protein